MQRKLSFLYVSGLVRVEHHDLAVFYEACVYGGAKSPESQ